MSDVDDLISLRGELVKMSEALTSTSPMVTSATKRRASLAIADLSVKAIDLCIAKLGQRAAPAAIQADIL